MGVTRVNNANHLTDWRDRIVRIEQDLREKMRRHELVSNDVHVIQREQLTLGQRLSDKLAAIAGSWTFISCFTLGLAAWIILNAAALVHPWDKYPYILLNLILSTLAAIQAPIIMMSQNRQEARDRIRAEHDYEVNLKAELEIQELQRKLDELAEKRWQELLAIQDRQIELLERQFTNRSDPARPAPTRDGLSE